MHRFVMALLFGVSISMLAGCEQEGPMEQAGEEVDEAVDEAGDRVDDATER